MATTKKRKLTEGKFAKAKKVRAMGGKQREAANAKGVKVSQATVSLAEKFHRKAAPSFKKAVAAGALPYDLVKLLPRLSKKRQAVWVRRLVKAWKLENDPDLQRYSDYKVLRKELTKEVRGIAEPSHKDVVSLLGQLPDQECDDRFLLGLAAGIGFCYGYFNCQVVLDDTGLSQMGMLHKLPPPPRGSSRLPLQEVLEKLLGGSAIGSA